MKKYTREDCIALLQSRYRVLCERGETRYPQRTDFEQDEVVAIKAFLGPWSRALEAAQIKPVDPQRAEKKKAKRIAAKQKMRAAKQRSRADIR